MDFLHTINRAESVYFAQPYNLDATGFYFQTLEEYQTRAAACRDAFGAPVEEFELQFIDGDNHELFNTLGVTQALLADWFDTWAELDPDSDLYTIVVFLLGYGYGPDQALQKAEDVALYRGRAEDYAQELYEDCMAVPEHLQYYIDYDRIARDLIIGGDLHEIGYELYAVGVL